jgi:hypothetical protein
MVNDIPAENRHLPGHLTTFPVFWVCNLLGRMSYFNIKGITLLLSCAKAPEQVSISMTFNLHPLIVSICNFHQASSAQ